MSHHLSRKQKNTRIKVLDKKKSKTINKVRKNRIQIYSKKKNISRCIRGKKSIYSNRNRNRKLKGKGIKNEKISFSKTKRKSLCSELDYNSCSKIRHKNKKIRICKFNYKKQFCESI
jgi:hypothetical protein